MEIWSINTSNNPNVPLLWFKTLMILASAKNNRCCSFDGKHTILFIHLTELIVTTIPCKGKISTTDADKKTSCSTNVSLVL